MLKIFNKKICLKNKIKKKRSKKNQMKQNHKNKSGVKTSHHKSRLSKTQKLKVELRNKKSKKALNNCLKSTLTRTSHPESIKYSLDKLRYKAHLLSKPSSKKKSRLFHGTCGKKLKTWIPATRKPDTEKSSLQSGIKGPISFVCNKPKNLDWGIWQISCNMTALVGLITTQTAAGTGQ